MEAKDTIPRRDVSEKHLYPISRSYKGFTLVELIVVITILTILGTIAFVQIGGFAGSARDSDRISDLTNISKGLDIYRIRAGIYPTPSIPSGASGLTTMSYSGSLVFSQWVIGDSVIAAIGSMGSRMSKKPMDPLRTTTEYMYSISANTAEYQIKTDWEGDSVAFIAPQSPHPNPLPEGEGITLINQVSASSGNPILSYIKGNYNGVIVRTKTTPIYFLALPSIITSATGALTHTGISNKILVHGETNSGGIVYDTTVANFLVYSSGALPSTDAERILLGSGIARAYSGTSLGSKVSIKPFVDALATNNTGSLASLGGGVVTSVGGSAVSGGGGGSGGGGSTPTTPAVCGTANGSTGSVAPSTSPLSNVCSVGTLSGSVSGAGPWNWTCNSTDGGNSASCTQYSNLVNGACTGLQATGAVYYGAVTSYSLVNASAGTSLVASGVTTPVVNTCQFGCNSGYILSGGSCIVNLYAKWVLRDTTSTASYYASCYAWNGTVCWNPVLVLKNSSSYWWLNWWNNEISHAAYWCNLYFWTSVKNFSKGNFSGSIYWSNIWSITWWSIADTGHPANWGIHQWRIYNTDIMTNPCTVFSSCATVDNRVDDIWRDRTQATSATSQTTFVECN